ncbi:DsrE family protein [Sulfurimonas sp. MAG313]|nr:DsrE family protein [Sulfurimonas sp. MAG313]MDF1880170.1 DsrE family protein [Sulfurimonas sp. MAG313]
MKKILITILILSASLFAVSDKAVVYDLTTGDISRFEQRILSGIGHNMTHYEGKLETLKVAVIIHGESYKFFIKNFKGSSFAKDKALAKVHKEFGERLRSLVKFYKVEFIVCGSGIKHRKIKESDLYNFVSVTPNAAIGLIDKQADGYAYIPTR